MRSGRKSATSVLACRMSLVSRVAYLARKASATLPPRRPSRPSQGIVVNQQLARRDYLARSHRVAPHETRPWALEYSRGLGSCKSWPYPTGRTPILSFSRLEIAAYAGLSADGGPWGALACQNARPWRARCAGRADSFFPQSRQPQTSRAQPLTGVSGSLGRNDPLAFNSSSVIGNVQKLLALLRIPAADMKLHV